MGYGCSGKLLKINMTTSLIETEMFDENFYRLYPGGKALAAFLLLREISPSTEPLSPANVLVFTNGLITGSPLTTATRFTVAARSPLTGAYGESEAGGFWGPELKFAGYEGIIITGRANHPVYIWINDDKVEIRDAGQLWGKETEEVQSAIRSELGDERIRILQIGIAGENMVRFASLTNELRHFNGRTGMGAVMGSKNLRGIAVRGHGHYLDLAHDPQMVTQLSRQFAKEVKEHPQSWELQDKGTPGLMNPLNASGLLPTRNFHGGSFDKIDRVNWEAYQKIFSVRKSCYACAVRCKRDVTVDDRYKVSPTFGGPEYETLAALSSNLCIDDLQAIAKASELCNRYCMDSISVGGTIAFAFECYENGLINAAQTGGLELKWGDANVLLELIEMIAHRKGFGNLLAEGSRRAAEVIGRNAMDYAIQVKGQEAPMHEPRGKVGTGIGYVVSESGADHLTSIHDTTLQNPESVSYKAAQKWGLKEAIPALSLGIKKAKQYLLFENWSSLGRVIGLCYFGPAPRSFMQAEEVLQAIKATSGWDLTVEEALVIGERATNLARIFNVREGFRRADDSLPKRFFEPLESGILKGVSISYDDFEAMIDDLFMLKGWDPKTGIPLPEKLLALGLGWAEVMIGDKR